ncbi:MAG: hypothetical protein DRO11_06135, partial [Methanobacteriota archaeon]
LAMCIPVVGLVFGCLRLLGSHIRGPSSDPRWYGGDVGSELNPRVFGLEALFWVVVLLIFLVVLVAMLLFFYVRRGSHRGEWWAGLSAERKKRMAVYRELGRDSCALELKKFFDSLETGFSSHRGGDVGIVSIPVHGNVVSVDVVASDTIGVKVVDGGVVRMFYRVFPGVFLLSAGVEGSEVVVRFRVLGGVDRKT